MQTRCERGRIRDGNARSRSRIERESRLSPPRLHSTRGPRCCLARSLAEGLIWRCRARFAVGKAPLFEGWSPRSFVSQVSSVSSRRALGLLILVPRVAPRGTCSSARYKCFTSQPVCAYFSYDAFLHVLQEKHVHDRPHFVQGRRSV